MNIFSKPIWIDEYEFPYDRFEEVPDALFEKVSKRLDSKKSGTPLVSVVIIAWNEEVNILRAISSISNMQTQTSFEVIVVNNNSNDRTQDTLDKLGVTSFFQPIQGWGPARQLGLEKATGQYILIADADCIYPPNWMNRMMRSLQKPGVVCVYGRYSFIPESGFPRWKLFLLECMKDVIAEVRHIKRPYLNAYGISMGYIREYALKEGYVMHKIRGEDGRLCFDLMKYGKVKQVKSSDARAWTSTRTLQKDGSFFQGLKMRVSKEVGRLFTMFTIQKAHDTKTSTNDE